MPTLSRVQYVGVNTGHEPDYAPARIRGAGLNCVRIVMMQHNVEQNVEFVKECHRRGVAVLGLLTRETFEAPEHGYVTTYAQGMDKLLRNFAVPGCTLDFWQLWNEFDGVGHESNTAPVDRVNEMIAVCAPLIRSKDDDAVLIAPSSVSGQSASYVGLNWDYLDYQAPHPYAKTPETADVMLHEYADRWGKPFFITEFGWPHPDPVQRGMYFSEMVEMFESRGDVVGATWYCWDRSQHPQPFFINDGDEYTKAIPLIQDLHVRPAVVVNDPAPSPDPAPPPPSEYRNGYFVGQGVRQIVDAHGLTVLGREDYFNTNNSLTPATPQSVLWVQSANRGLLVPNTEA